MRRQAAVLAWLLVALMASGRLAHAQLLVEPAKPTGGAEVAAAGEGEGEGEGPAEGDDVLAFISNKNFTIVVKNVTQDDHSSNSHFGIGIDWQYAFGKDFEFLLPSRVMLSGSGMTSLGDPNTSPAEAPQASNFNSIINQFRYSANHLFEPQRRQFRPPPVGDPEAVRQWIEDSHRFAIEEEQRIAKGYTAIDLGAQAQTESSQTFQSTQVALGGSLSLASAWATNMALYPLKYLVPDQKKYGDVIRPVILFLAIEEVLGANHQETQSNAGSDFARFRLEVAWSTELLLNGLYPFVHYHLYQDLSADPAPGKRTAQWLEVGANYYVADKIEALRGLLGAAADRGPFVTVRYASGELPPYLEQDHQASAGLGFDF